MRLTVEPRQPKVPSPAEIRQSIDRLRDVLVKAASEEDAQDRSEARAVLRHITGGRIEMSQQGEPRAKRGWLRAAFQLHLVSPLTEPPIPPDVRQQTLGPTISVDFREATQAERLADRVAELARQGKMLAEIAVELGIGRNRVTAIWQHWHRAQGLKVPDGRARRSHLPRKHLVTPKYQQIAERVMTLHGEGKLLYQIAQQLEVDRNTVTAAIAWWHESRGSTPPDGRSRRKELSVKSRPYHPCQRST